MPMANSRHEEREPEAENGNALLEIASLRRGSRTSERIDDTRARAAPAALRSMRLTSGFTDAASFASFLSKFFRSFESNIQNEQTCFSLLFACPRARIFPEVFIFSRAENLPTSSRTSGGFPADLHHPKMPDMQRNRSTAPFGAPRNSSSWRVNGRPRGFG